MLYCRNDILRLRTKTIRPNPQTLDLFAELDILRYRGNRGGRKRKRIITTIITMTPSFPHRLGSAYRYKGATHKRSSCKHSAVREKLYRPNLLYPSYTQILPPQETKAQHDASPPVLYVFNSASVAKPHAKEQLTAELIGYNVDIAIITETHFKKKHTPAM